MSGKYPVWECMGSMSARVAEVAELAVSVMDQMGVAELTDNVAWEVHHRMFVWDGETDQDRVDCIRKILENVSFSMVGDIKSFVYRTDGEMGEILAPDFTEAKEILLSMVFPYIADGSWGWVDDEDGERFYVAPDNMG